MLSIIFLGLALPKIKSLKHRKIQFLGFLTDFSLNFALKTCCTLKMFLLSARNNFYVIMSSYLEEHVKKISSLNFMSLLGFQASKSCMFFWKNYYRASFEIISRQK